MPSEQEMIADLEAADAAGDTQLATHIAGLIKQARGGQPQQTPQMGALNAIEPAVTPAKARAEAESKAWRASMNPAAGGHPMQNLVEGVGSFLPRVGLAARQGAASLGFGDRDALSREAEEQTRLNKPLFDTAGGGIGKMLPEFGLSMAGGGGPTVAKQILGNVGTGALLSAAEPEKNYDLKDKLTFGGMVGGASDLVGRGVGFLARPFRKTSPGAIENTKLLEDAGLPNPLASTRAGGGSYAVPMTQALEQIPGISLPLKKALDANAEWFTRKMSKDAGMEVSNITDSTRRAIDGRLNTISAGLRDRAAPADETTIKRSLEFAKLSQGQNLSAVGMKDVLKKFDNAIEALTDGAKLSPDDLLKRRSIATDSMHSADEFVEKQAYKAIRDAYDEAYIHANPNMADAFKTYKEQYGAFKDLVKAADKGLGRGDTIFPANMRAATDFGEGVAKSDRDRLIQAAAQQMPTPPGGWNRAGYIAMMLGAPLGMGGVTKTMGGDWDASTAAGGTLAASIVHGLSRKPVSKSTENLLRSLLTAGGISGGT